MEFGINNRKEITILWFSNTPANADEYYNSELKGTGGWLKSLDQELQKKVKLCVAYYSNDDKSFKYKNTSYYPIRKRISVYHKMLKKFGLILQKYEADLEKYLEIIKTVKPDLIHIHGTENSFSSIIKNVDIPIVISIQGNINVILYKYFSGFEISFLKNVKFKYFKSFPYLSIQSLIYQYKFLKNLQKKELEYLSLTKNIIGRTEWDRRITEVMAPGRKYFIGHEVLRSGFYLSRWEPDFNRQKLIIHSTTSSESYKGFETLCLSLRLLNDLNFPCEWHIAGVNRNDLIVSIAKKKLKARFPNEGLVFKGKLNEVELIKSLLNADLFVMPSHIDNSPNSLCEAMILGVPCISTFVGGTGSIIEDKKTGILIQSGDPWVMAGAIMELAENKSAAIRYSEEGRNIALKRHNKEEIVNQIISIYQEIISNKR